MDVDDSAQICFTAFQKVTDILQSVWGRLVELLKLHKQSYVL